MNLRHIIDLSHPLDRNTPVYPGDPTFHCSQFCTVAEDRFAVQKLELSSHAGTHIDTPSHRFDNLPSIDTFPISHFIRRALVIDVSHKGARQPITVQDLAKYHDKIQEGMAVLFMTGWSKFWEDKEYKYFDSPWLERAVAQHLVDLGVKVVGIDAMSPDQMPRVPVLDEETYDLGVHDIVLGAGCIIAENLTNLETLMKIQNTSPEVKIMVSLVPHKIVGCDGSPVRAYAWTE
ncbi:putative cyclase [Amylostereum chailletii]|nr:putative cyclase [Amylostereum chailletii]